jgi:hypothetical protein
LQKVGQNNIRKPYIANKYHGNSALKRDRGKFHMGNFIENADMLEILPPSSIITNSSEETPSADIAFPTEAIFKGDTSQLILHRTYRSSS